MAHSPQDDRSDSENPNSDRNHEGQHRGHPVDSNSQHGSGQADQQQGAPDRDFAPGEDGECH